MVGDERRGLGVRGKHCTNNVIGVDTQTITGRLGNSRLQCRVNRDILP